MPSSASSASSATGTGEQCFTIGCEHTAVYVFSCPNSACHGPTEASSVISAQRRYMVCSVCRDRPCTFCGRPAEQEDFTTESDFTSGHCHSSVSLAPASSTISSHAVARCPRSEVLLLNPQSRNDLIETFQNAITVLKNLPEADAQPEVFQSPVGSDGLLDMQQRKEVPRPPVSLSGMLTFLSSRFCGCLCG